VIKSPRSTEEMQLDTSILEARILLHETDFPGIFTINRCADKLQALKNSVNDDTSAVEAFSKEILYFKLEMGKLNRNFRTCDSESANYRATAESAAAEIQKARDDVIKLQSDLVGQQEIRVHRELLEVIAKTVNTKENKSSLKRKISSVEDSIRNLEDSIEAADTQLQVRAKQFDSLMDSIAVLQGELIEEGIEKLVEEAGSEIDVLEANDIDGSNYRSTAR
jgi:chromosome segregation ATPase